MNESVLSGTIEKTQTVIMAWIDENVFVTGNLVQTGVVLIAFAVAYFAGPRLAAFILEHRVAREGRAATRTAMAKLAGLAVPIIWLIQMWMVLAIASQAEWARHLIQIAASLTSAWVVIRFAMVLIRDPAWATFISITAWTLAALSTLGLFNATVELLDSLAITLGNTRISTLMVVQSVLSLAILLWLAFATSEVLERRIKRAPNLTPSAQVLFGKLTKIALVTLAFLLAINMVGIDLTTFAVFGGALGVGIGLGLQKIIANFISGMILLLDKSIKPGDVISLGPTVGWVESLGARYVSVRTRDGTEHLIPNEELIVQRVENWSHTDRAVRLKLPIGIAYKSDLRLAMKLCLKAASDVSRVLADPEPRCPLRGFGDSTVDLELRFWIDDPQNGRSSVVSDVLLSIWDKFNENGIEFPFPQRELHIKSSDLQRFQGADGDVT